MKAIPSGETIGVVGGGQLGRMLAFEAKRLGYRIAILDPDPDGPAAQVADVHIQGQWSDFDAAKRLAEASAVVTMETEHVPAELLRELESITPVRPGAEVLHTIQDRLRQRRFLEQAGLPQPAFASVEHPEDVSPAAETVGFPAVLKSRRDGYDGKGQARVESLAELEAAWEDQDRIPATLEAFVDFKKEVSSVIARGVDGEIVFYPVAENEHRRHILHTTSVPAVVSEQQVAEAEEITRKIAGELGHVGTLAVEFFATRDGHLLVNEIAPRTHNSGHFTYGACATSQFEQHARAICGLPLGDPSLIRPVVMLNLLGDLWADGEPDWAKMLSIRGAQLHLYQKREAKVGRKMGHLLLFDDDLARARASADALTPEYDAIP